MSSFRSVPLAVTIIYGYGMQPIAVLCKQRIKYARRLGKLSPPPKQNRESFHNRIYSPGSGTYLDVMTPAARPAPGDDLRRVRFSRFMERVLGAAKDRGMTVKQIEEATKVSKSTFYRWRDGTFFPKTDELRRFCKGMGVPIAEAYAALGWEEVETERAAPEPIITDPDLRSVLRTLNDPNVSPADKLRIRRMLRALAADVESTEK